MNSHNSRVIAWLGCLKPEANYAPFTLSRLKRGGPVSHVPRGGFVHTRGGAVVEQCWRNVLDAFGATDVLLPREKPKVAHYQGSYFMASSAQLHRHRREVYARAHSLFAGGDGRCHKGELHWDRLYTNRTGSMLALDVPELTKHTHGSAWEMWQHVVIGGMTRLTPMNFDHHDV